jgi:hypothetical protein
MVAAAASSPLPENGRYSPPSPPLSSRSESDLAQSILKSIIFFLSFCATEFEE